MKDILDFDPIKKFLKAVGKGIEGYFGKDKGAIVYLEPHGVWYAEGLFRWLAQKGKDITITGMEDGGANLKEEKIRGRKVLLVDGDIVTGKAYKRSTEALRAKESALSLKGIKFATYIDRVGLADYSVWEYSSEAVWRPEDIDALDLKIISFLGKNGRISFAEIGKKIHLSQVAVKNRIDSLMEKEVLAIRGVLNIDKFYTISAGIQIAADSKTVEKLLERFKEKQEIYHLAKRSGRYSLAVGLLARSIEGIEAFVNDEVRAVPGVHNIDVFIGELPVVPTIIPPRIKEL